MPILLEILLLTISMCCFQDKFLSMNTQTKDLVKFTEEIPNEKLHFLCGALKSLTL